MPWALRSLGLLRNLRGIWAEIFCVKPHAELSHLISRLLHTEVLVPICSLSLSRPSFKFPACTHTNLMWLLQSWSRDQELDKGQKNLQFGTYARRFF
jgi:hypothetical protein